MKEYAPVYEANITGALRNYYLFGIEPGSFTKALIQDEFEEAFNRAHTLIKNVDSIRGLMAGMKLLIPPQCLSENYDKWVKQGGLRGSSEEDRFAIKLTGNYLV